MGKKLSKKILVIIMTIAMLVPFMPDQTLPVHAATIVHQGKCGDDVTFTLTSDGTLTLSGTGKTYRYHENVMEHEWTDYSSQIKNVVVEDGITELGEALFCRLKNLKTATIADSVTESAEDLFRECTNLVSVKLSDNMEELKWMDFYSCTSLRSIKLPSKVKTLGFSCFRECTSLSEIIFGNQLEYIGDYAFENCTSLKTIKIPSSVRKMEKGVFRNCTSLEKVTLSPQLKWIDKYTFERCTAMKSIVIPKGVTRIMHQAFHDCSSLKTVSIPSTVQHIADSAFDGCMALKTKVPSFANKVKKNGPEYNYEIFLVNPYDEIYTRNGFSSAFIYVKTDNPYPDTFELTHDYYPGVIWGVRYCTHDDVEYVEAEAPEENGCYRVKGGYLYPVLTETAGTYHFFIQEILEDDTEFKVDTGVGLDVTFVDYEATEEKWLKGLIAKYSKPGMTKKEIFEAVCLEEFVIGSRYRYSAIYDDHVVDLLAEEGPIWQSHRMHSTNSPELMVQLGHYLGYEVKRVAYGLKNPLHAYVEEPDGSLMMICPSVDSGRISSLEPYTLPRKQHDYGEGVVTRKATDTEYGIVTYKCKDKDCTATKATYIPVKQSNNKKTDKAKKSYNTVKNANKYGDAAIAKTSITKVTNLSDGVKLSWKKVPGAAGYVIYCNGKKIKTVNKGTTLKYTDKKSIKNGTKRKYQVVVKKKMKGVIHYGRSSSAKTTIYLRPVKINSARNAAKGSLCVTWKKNTKATGYQVKYVTGKKTKVVNAGKKITKKLSGLKKGKTYKIYVRSYVKKSGKTYYSGWSKVRKLKLS